MCEALACAVRDFYWRYKWYVGMCYRCERGSCTGCKYPKTRRDEQVLLVRSETYDLVRGVLKGGCAHG